MGYFEYLLEKECFYVRCVVLEAPKASCVVLGAPKNLIRRCLFYCRLHFQL